MSPADRAAAPRVAAAIPPRYAAPMRTGWAVWFCVAVTAACGARTEFIDDQLVGPVEVGGSAGRGAANSRAGAGGKTSGGGRNPLGSAGPGSHSAGTTFGGQNGASGFGGQVSAAGSAITPTPAVGCFNDSDCPGWTCGGDVCNWSKISPNPQGQKIFLCNPAGTDPQGMDGWCTTDADCKCRAQGARCVAPYCSFTLEHPTIP